MDRLERINLLLEKLKYIPPRYWIYLSENSGKYPSDTGYTFWLSGKLVPDTEQVPLLTL